MTNCEIKTCTKCKETKELAAFSKNQDWCKLCNKAYREVNREAIAAQSKAHYEANREAIAAQKKAHYEANRERYRAYNKAYKAANRDKLNSLEAKREAKKLQASPPWITKDDLAAVEGFYTAANGLAPLAGCKLQVDHVIPLLGKEVCGLHVPWNLQLLTAEENNKKKNKLPERKDEWLYSGNKKKR